MHSLNLCPPSSRKCSAWHFFSTNLANTDAIHVPAKVIGTCLCVKSGYAAHLLDEDERHMVDIGDVVHRQDTGGRHLAEDRDLVPSGLLKHFRAVKV